MYVILLSSKDHYIINNNKKTLKKIKLFSDINFFFVSFLLLLFVHDNNLSVYVCVYMCKLKKNKIIKKLIKNNSFFFVFCLCLKGEGISRSEREGRLIREVKKM